MLESAATSSAVSSFSPADSSSPIALFRSVLIAVGLGSPTLLWCFLRSSPGSTFSQCARTCMKSPPHSSKSRARRILGLTNPSIFINGAWRERRVAGGERNERHS
ncbi:hypothetical protein TIFTF001_048525 [Ficus carica]|uniref:Uncharacterized protein n=1 Tax=Ficus carica TaxID=3494 RepID=A0AA88CUD3_FICCA|nr:hypothetical protein TIFTF001_048525 [Ficus carica]